MKRKREHYDYLPLREAVMRKGETVNFYGAVSEYANAKPTRGSDVLCTMTLVDMSYDNPGLRVLVFSSATNGPLVKSIGDIIRVHRVEMGDFNGEPQAIANINRKSSFILFEGKDGSGYEPYQKSHASYSFDPHDERGLDVMRNWIESHPLSSRVSDYLRPISGIKEGLYFDLCCKVIFVDDDKPSESSTVIYVWDGTDQIPWFIFNSGPETDAQKASPYVHSVLPRDLLCDIPPVGTMLPIMLLNSVHGQVPQRGDWVKFRNLACKRQSDMLQVNFTRESKFSLLSTETELVKTCERRYEKRILSSEGRLPEWCMSPQSMTVTDFEHVCFSTLREVLAYPQVTYKFRCLVRVISTYPSAVVDFCAPTNDTGKNNDGVEMLNPEFVYGVLLTLEDSTARLKAYLIGEDAAKFFNGHPPADLHQNGPVVGALERKVHKLLGTRFSPQGEILSVRDPPFIKCCIKSFYTDKSNPHESRCFGIFGTTFPG